MNPDIESTTEEQPVEGEAAQETTAENTEESATSENETPDKGKTDGNDEAEKPRKSGFQKRINKLTREKYEALKRAEEMARKAAELEAKVSGKDISEPDPVDFDDYNDFLKAHAQWVKESVKREITQTQQPEESISPDEVILADTVNNIMVDGAEKYDDFMQVVGQNPNLPISKDMVQVVAESDQSADILYFLGKNPQIAESLYDLSGTALAREIGKLEATLRSGSNPRRKVTKAPDPISPTTEQSAPDVDENNMSIDEWIARRNKQVIG